MADLFQPKQPPWAPGPQGDTPITAAELQRIENGIDAIDQAVDRHGDRLDSLNATVSSLSLHTMPSGPTSGRPSPTPGRMYFDTTIGMPIVGTGSSWLQFGGGEVGGPGSSNAPANFTLTVNPDNSILCSWSAVPGADYYKLYEVRSPNGVDGATELAETSSLRGEDGGLSMGYYEYWATAFVDGVESADSRHGIGYLPYGSTGPGGGGSAGSPAELLALGAGGGEWNLGVGYPDGHEDIEPDELEDGWSEAPYFYINDSGTAVHFQTPMDGGRTSSNTKYPRTELREYRGGSKASWDGDEGEHFLSGRTRILHMEDDKREYCFAQMHDGDDDTLQLRWEDGTIRASINGDTHDTELGDFDIGEEFAWEIHMDDGTLRIRINGSTRITTDPGYGSGQYFKVGSYPQQNSRDQDNPDSGYASLEMRDLVRWHND